MRILSILFFLIVAFPSNAQKYVKLIEKADQLNLEQKYNDAILTYIEALTDMKKEGKNTLKEYTTLLNKVAKLCNDQAEYEAAYTLYKETVSNCEIVYGKKTRSYFEALYYLADFNRNQERYLEAEQQYKETLALIIELKGKDNAYYAECQNGLGLCYTAIEKYEKAREAFEEAILVGAKTPGKQSKGYVKILNNSGMFYNTIDAFKESENAFQEAIEICKTLGIEKSILYATCLNNLGVLYADYGMHNQALNLQLDGISITSELYGTVIHPQHLLPTINIAAELQLLKSYDLAKQYYDLAFQISEKFYSKESIVHMSLLDLYSSYLIIHDKIDEAEKISLECVALRKKVQGTESKAYATSLSNLANIYMIIGQLEKSESMYTQALAITEKVYGIYHSDYCLMAANLGQTYFLQNKNAEAEKYFMHNVSYSLKEYSVILPGLSEKEKKAFVKSKYSTSEGNIDFMLSYSAQKPAILGDLFNYTIATKGLIFQSGQKMRTSILESGNTELIDLYDKWKKKNDYLVQVWQTPSEELKKLNIEEEKVVQEVYTLEKELSKKSSLLNISGVNEKYTWQDIQKKLKPGEAAVEIIRIKKLRVEPSKKYIDMDNDTCYAILIVTPQTQNNPTLIYLENGGNAETKSIKYYRNCIMYRAEDLNSYNTFWKPIAKELAKSGTKKVFISNDGVYHQLNLLSLKNPETKKFVSEEMDIQLVCNSNDIIKYNSDPAAARKLLKDYQIYLYGYPNYSGKAIQETDNSKDRSMVSIEGLPVDTTQRFLNGKGKVKLLPGTKKEVEFIHGFAKTKNLKATIFLEEKASEENLKQLKNPDILHIATHGFFLTNIPKESNNERGFSGMNSSTVNQNSLLRSGLLLANCENSLMGNASQDTASKEDGVLTAQEALSLNLSKTELVVLSACETGLGEINNGEGVYGLQRSFQQAGAKTIMMSLWTVSDEATQEMMIKFYTYLLSGKKKRDAFNAAQKDLRLKYPDPYFWGAFVMVGE